jgi:hypothetical protein
MRDILREYRDAVVELMAEDLEIVHREVLDDRVKKQKRYKFLMGKIEGLKDATRSLDVALKKMRTFDDE